jgi:hypothetical protein
MHSRPAFLSDIWTKAGDAHQRDRQISPQLQEDYAQLDEMTELTVLTVLLKQLRAEGVAVPRTRLTCAPTANGRLST